ncbi:hypothetical protein U1Q18_052314, partial [Sarracenia purpurea var. burkii]
MAQPLTDVHIAARLEFCERVIPALDIYPELASHICFTDKSSFGLLRSPNRQNVTPPQMVPTLFWQQDGAPPYGTMNVRLILQQQYDMIYENGQQYQTIQAVMEAIVKVFNELDGSEKLRAAVLNGFHHKLITAATSKLLKHKLPMN